MNDYLVYVTKKFRIRVSANDEAAAYDKAEEEIIEDPQSYCYMDTDHRCDYLGSSEADDIDDVEPDDPFTEEIPRS